MQRMQVCTRVDVVMVCQWHGSMRDTTCCARAHAYLNVSAVTARVHTRITLVCTRESDIHSSILSTGSNDRMCAA